MGSVIKATLGIMKGCMALYLLHGYIYLFIYMHRGYMCVYNIYI